MKKIKVPDKLAVTANRLVFSVKKNSPEILAVTGIVGVVVCTVLACKATLKLDDILEETKETIDKIHEVVNDPTKKDVYTKEDSQKDLTRVYLKAGVSVVKLYTPAFVVGAASIGCMLTSNNILRKRNVALAAAYATIDKGFKEYRGRVVERFGEEVDKELKYNVKTKTVEETIIDEKGKEKVVKKEVKVADINETSEYARFFDSSCIAWEKDAELNLTYLRTVEKFANDRLRLNGHLFLNEVYDDLGIKRTAAGQCVGWIYNENNPVGDNYVDFGMYRYNSERNRAFVNGYEPVILLDFNVDGDIHNLI